MNPCTVPTIPIDSVYEEWMKQHEDYVFQGMNCSPNIVLIGASIIQFVQCFPIWKNKFEPLNSLNFGIAGDQVQNVLWRVKNGILDRVKPKVCILNIGSNNTDNTPAEISEGILAIVNEIQSKLPYCNIMIIGLLPRGARPNPLRNLAIQVNEIVSQKVKNMSKVEFFNTNLLQPDGSLSEEDAPDFLHPSEKGYVKMFGPIFERIAQILNDFI